MRVERGTTLVEAVVAVGLLAGAVVAMAGLASLAVRTSALAREHSYAAILALQKMEALARGAAAAPASPAGAWAADTAGFVEYLDARGRPVAAGARGAFVRRWSVVPLPADPGLVSIQVAVAPCRPSPGASRCGRAPALARLATIRSRTAW